MGYCSDKKLLALVTRGVDALEHLVEECQQLRFVLGHPGALTIVELEIHMGQISFKVVLPALVDADVVSRELSVQVGDGAPDVRQLPPDTAEADGYSGPQDAPVTLALTDIDDAGNRSRASTLTTTLVDVFPPAQPGQLSLVETGEA